MIRAMLRYDPDDNLMIGTIIEVDGNHIVAELDPSIEELSRVYQGEIYQIGQFGSVVKIHFGRKLLFAYVTRLRMKSDYERESGLPISTSNIRVIEAELFGEGECFIGETGQCEVLVEFRRGVTTYPLPQQRVYLTSSVDLKGIYERSSTGTIRLGTYVGAGNISCSATVDELFSKHCAVLGSTGSGKSATVAAILHAVQEYGHEDPENWHPHVIILDPHNEYGNAFPGASRLVSDEGSLTLPYWLLNLQELLDLIIGKTEFQATSQTNIVKLQLLGLRKQNASKVGLSEDDITVDSPIPFSIRDLEARIRSDMPPQQSKQDSHQSILNKIDILRRDSRLEFLMRDWSDRDGDPLPAIISQFVGKGPSMKLVDLSGIPNDVAGVVSSAVARLLFMYKLWQKKEEREQDPIVLVCEEAHRYVPDSGEAEYAEAQSAIRRIAKEGRKYGIGLILVSQRPSEVDSTVLSQCNSWLVLRLTNSQDQEYVRKFLPDSLSGLTKILPSLMRREAIFIGQAASIPARIMIRELSSEQLPRSQDMPFVKGWSTPPADIEFIKEVGQRWRKQVREARGLAKRQKEGSN